MKYITYTIETLENVKMGGHGSAHDIEYALSYIAGSTIRGAFISKYLKKYNVKDLSLHIPSRELLLGGKMKFLNAYPKVEDERCIPFPNCFYANKIQLKNFGNETSISDHIKLYNGLENPIEQDMEKARVAEFCLLQGETYSTTNVEKIFNLHIAKNKEKNNIYRYEAIKKGQAFMGLIAFEGTDYELEHCTELLEGNIFYFGGSKGTGYGRCRVSNVEVFNNNVEVSLEEISEEDFTDEFYILALSDIVSRNQFGQVIGDIDKAYLGAKLGLDEVELVGSAVATQLIGGYNSKWKTRLPQINGIKAGSVFKYRFKGTMSISKIYELMDKGIGDRKEEGYGRILITDYIGGSYARPCQENNKEAILAPEMKPEEKFLLESVLIAVLKNRVDQSIKREVFELRKKFVNKLNPTQAGKIMQVFVKMKSMTPEEGTNYLATYLKNIENKENNKTVYYQYLDSKVDGKGLLNYLKERVTDLCKTDNFNQFHTQDDQKNIEVFEIKPKIELTYVYQTKVRVLEEFFRFINIDEIDKQKEGEA